MKAADWIVDYLISKGVADAFGLPGAVVLEFLYAMDRRKAELTPHLNYHEQGASFAACGYAQATGKLGIAYATRGPGMTNKANIHLSVSAYHVCSLMIGLPHSG